ncbi:alkylmercury lyase family protein [Amycolatopsis roodepoortensis]|uniref:alkylmercury lyase family protein n=1 Tax=Amycolatopsis roodepoortensis TaxID=700274 RepID=UPI00214B4B3E|nr:alkylmercury lyase family protein [Amycolatopsis roodepoortensis]UUV35857.1 alkylmercury lyase family protein [Amycolatopsis roodepoortensis]
MELVVLSVPDCPHVALVDDLLRVVLADRPGVRVVHREVLDQDQAEREGMRGSPTLLVNGTDPFAEPGSQPSVSCRLFRDEHGQARPAPSEAVLVAALAQASGTEPPRVSLPPRLREILGVDGQRRPAPQERGQRAIQQAVLRSFSATGCPPTMDELARVAAESSTTAPQVLAALHRGDFLRLDEAGRITAAYPFSALPTRHRVTLAGGVRVFAMCAVDALGIPAMLATDAEIVSTTPDGADVVVAVHGGRPEAEPSTAVVVFAGTGCDAGPAAEVCCGHLNFFTSHADAVDWAAAHPDVPGTILSVVEAGQLGREIFGSLLV